MAKFGERDSFGGKDPVGKHDIVWRCCWMGLISLVLCGSAALTMPMLHASTTPFVSQHLAGAQDVGSISRPLVALETAVQNGGGNGGPSSGTLSVGGGGTPTVALCFPVKDEAAYLDEYVDYYAALGFHTIYVYDNSKDFELKQWAEEKKKLGCPINATHFPGEAVQQPVLLDCAKRALADGHTWGAFFDIDEFLILKKHDNVVSFLGEYCQQGALSIHWVMMGTGRREVYSPQPLTKRFRYRMGYPDKLMKSFAVLQHMNLDKKPHPHYPYLKPGYTRRSTSGEICYSHKQGINRTGTEKDQSTDVALLYHYSYRSHKEFLYKRLYRGDVSVNSTHPFHKGWIRRAKLAQIPPGLEFDDTAWRAVRNFLPKYRYYDELFPDPPQSVPNLSQSTRSSGGRTVALCLAVENGEAYVDEFVEYHIALGFDAIYLYNNNTAFELKQWGEEKRRLGYRINVTHYPGDAMPKFALDCAKRALADGHNWGAFFELDDFLVLKKHTHVVSFLAEYCPQGALSIHRVPMGTGQRVVYSPQPLTKRFKYRTAYPSEEIKSIFVLNHIDMSKQPHAHHLFLKDGYKRAMTSGETCTSDLWRVDPDSSNAVRNTDVALLYHYGYKSCKEYLQRQVLREAINDPNHTTFLGMSLDRNLPTGQNFDDTAWKSVKEIIPAYEYYDALFPEAAVAEP